MMSALASRPERGRRRASSVELIVYGPAAAAVRFFYTRPAGPVCAEGAAARAEVDDAVAKRL